MSHSVESPSAPSVVLRYVGHQSPHGVLMPPPGVPARDLTQADLDELPFRTISVVDEGEHLLLTRQRISADDLLAFNPPIYARARADKE